MKQHLLSVFSYELTRNVRRKGYLFATFGIPLVGFIIFIAFQAFSGSSPEEQITELEFDIKGITSAGYVDLSGMFPEPGPYAEEVMTRYESETAADNALEAGDIEVYYIIAEDYLETAAVTLVVPRFSANQIVNAEIPIESMFFGQWVEEVPIETLVRLHVPSVVGQVEFSEDAENGVTRDEDTDFWLIYGFALIFLITLMSTNGYLMQSVIEEKETRLIEILISSVRPSELLAGKILAMSVLGLLQVSAYITVAIILTKMAANSSALVDTFVGTIEVPIEKLPLALIYFVLAYLFFAAGFSAVGALSNSMSEGPNLTLVFVLPALTPFYFITAFGDNPQGTIPVIMSIIPITAPIAMVMRITIASVPVVQIAVSLALLSLMTFGMIWLAGRLFRMHTLLAGHTPRLRDIPNLLR